MDGPLSRHASIFDPPRPPIRAVVPLAEGCANCGASQLDERGLPRVALSHGSSWLCHDCHWQALVVGARIAANLVGPAAAEGGRCRG